MYFDTAIEDEGWRPVTDQSRGRAIRFVPQSEGMVVRMYKLVFILPLFMMSLASAQQLPFGRVLVVGGLSATLTLLAPPPPVVESLTGPPQFAVYGLFVSVASGDPTVVSFEIMTRVETASGARIDLFGTVKRDLNLDWTTELFYTGKDPVVKVLTLSITPLQRNQVKVFSAES